MDEATRCKRLRDLPSIDLLLSHPAYAPLLNGLPRPLAVQALRNAVEDIRMRLLGGEDCTLQETDVQSALQHIQQPSLRRVLNATGVVLHTNLGRAPLAEKALRRIADVGQSYCNIEFDTTTGTRRIRYAHVERHLCALTGAEAALVVNNCAAAILLTFSTLAQHREAIVSRGELLEIGGGFRIPDIIQQSGAVLVEVGTTNRTCLKDYERALGPQTALLAKIHRANFAQVGFTEEVQTNPLAMLAKRHGVPLYEDVGSGALTPLSGKGLTEEATVAAVIAAGADVVSFSGDKLLGGPQAGILVGRSEWIERLQRHPLNRALRVDKLTASALEATLEIYRDELEATEIPTRVMLTTPLTVLKGRAEKLQGTLQRMNVPGRIAAVQGQVGGGAMPLATPPSWAVVLTHAAPEALNAHLRAEEIPVIARITDEAVCLDVRCLTDEEIEVAARCVAKAWEKSW